jgi:predicted Zn-dependent protease
MYCRPEGRWRAVLPRSLTRTILALLLAATLGGARASSALPRIGDEEIKSGSEAAAEAEKEHRLLEDPEANARVRQIGDALAAAANALQTEATYGSPTVVPFSYSFTIIDDADVNAFSIPGGHIYVYKGLIDFCESDHELAAVLAHEIAHCAHHHVVYLLRDQSRLEGRMILILVAGLLGDVDAMDMSNVMLGTQFYTIARTSSYGQKAERDADLAAIAYMTHANYNPVGILTFLERLARHPDVIDWGILQTHPRPAERVQTVRERLSDLGIQINRRLVTSSSSAMVRQAESGGAKSFEVVVGGNTICRLGQEAGAQSTAERINALLDQGLQVRELKVCGSSVTARGQSVVEIADDDAALAGKPAAQLAADAKAALRNVLFRQMVNDLW